MARIFVKFFGILARGSAHRVYLTIAQSKSGFFRDCFIIWACRMANLGVVVHLKGGNYHGFYYSQGVFIQFLIRMTLRRVSRILVLGESLRSMYDFDPYLKNRIRVVENGLPVNIDSTVKSLPGCQSDKPVELLFLSNLIVSKGYLHVLDSVWELKKIHDINVHCVFAGRFLSSPDDPSDLDPSLAEANFVRKIRDYELEDVVDVTGPITGEKKWEALKKSHFFLLPTNYIYEGQPVSIIEAMANGCVTITTDYRAIPDLVSDGESGIMVNYGSSEEITHAILSLINDPEQFKAMSFSATERFKSLFTMESHLDRIIPNLIEGFNDAP